MSLATTVTASQQQLPIFNISIGTQAVSGWSPRKLVVDTETGFHDAYTLDVLIADTDPARWLDEPISFQWGTPATGLSMFHGYVFSVNKSQDFQRQPLVRLVMLAPTAQLANGSPKYWSKVTSETIVREIAAKHRLSVVMDPHPYVWQQYAQTNESDWGIITKLADSLAYHATSYNGVIRLIDPQRTLARSGSMVDLYKSTNLLDTNAMLMDFSPVATSTTDRNVAPPNWGYSTADGTPKSVYDTGTNYKTDVFVTDEARAALVRESLTRSTNLWQYKATARIRGTNRLYPGTVVNIITGIKSSAQDSNDGHWLVTKVRHELSDTVYQTNLELVRNHSMGATGQLARPFWGNDSQPTVRLYNGRWVSSWKGGSNR